MPGRIGAPLVAAMGVVLVSLSTAMVIAREAGAARQRRFETALTATDERIRDRLQAQIALLHGGAGLFAAAPGLTCGQFADFVRRMELDEHYPGTLGVGVSMRVEPGALAAYEHEAGVRVWPSTPREVYHSIRCLEPRNARNRAALGYDMFTAPQRREAMMRAGDTGMAALSKRVELVQEITDDKQPGFLLYTPVYEDGAVPPDVESRRRRLRGFVYSPLRAHDFLSTALDETAGRLHVEIYDGETMSPATRLYGDEKGVGRRAPASVRAIDIAGHRWTVRYQALPSQQEARAQLIAGGVLGIGLMVALLLARALSRERKAAAEAARADQRAQESSALVARGEEQLVSIMDAVPALVSFIDRDERYMVVNRRYEEWFGRPRAAIEGRTAREVLGDHAYGSVGDALRSALEGRASSAEADLRMPDGARRFVLASYTPYFDARGAVQGAIALLANITDLKTAQLAVEASEGNLRAILNASLDAVVQMDAAGRIVFWNPRAEEIFGWPADEACGRLVADLIVPDAMREPHRRGLARLLETGEGPILGRRIEVDAIDRTGREFPVELTVTAIGRGDRLLFNAFISDQSDRKRSEAARTFLTEATVALSSSLERDHVRALIPKLATPYLAAGAALVTFSGLGTPAFAGEGGDMSGEDAQAWAARLAAQREGSGADDTRDTRDTGAASVLPLTAGGHEFGALVLTGAGITPGRPADDRIVAEEYARRAAMALHNAQLYDQAQTANQLKDEFLSTLSHELRTPANAILGWAQMAKEAALKGGDVSRALDAVLRNAHAQNDLISDILDAQRLTVGKVRLNVAPVDLDRVLAAAVDTVKPTAVAKRVAVRTETDAGCDVIGDEERLQQVFWNLLSNAVKFTPPGGLVEVICRRRESRVTIEVRDTGPGIAPEFLPFAFERFRQGDASATKSHSGLGLGLAIARSLTELHGGTIEASNRADGRTGACMRVHLPARDPSA